MTVRDPRELIEGLGRGESPESFSLGRTADGWIDLRGLALPQPRPTGRFHVGEATFDYASDKPIFDNLVLDHVDLSGALLENSYWRGCTFRHVRLQGLRGRGANFASSNMESVAFLNADLRNANWGLDGLDGPSLTHVDFVDTDMRGSSYGHPLFRDCRFVRCNLWRVNFYGSRFEDCRFEGPLNEVIFNGRDRDPNPRVAAIRNPMKNVDFVGAELRNVAFSSGIDLSTCTFPAKGYVKLARPRQAFERALGEVVATWKGPAKEQVEIFLSGMLKSHITEEQPFDILRVQDFEEPPWKPEVGKALLNLLLTSSRTA